MVYARMEHLLAIAKFILGDAMPQDPASPTAVAGKAFCVYRKQVKYLPSISWPSFWSFCNRCCVVTTENIENLLVHLQFDAMCGPLMYQETVQCREHHDVLGA